MKQSLINVSLIVLAIVAATCLISLMAVFMGGGQSGTDLYGLMLIQIAVIPIALGIFVINVYLFVAADGWANGVRSLWSAIPQWLVFIFLVLNSLSIAGEVAFLIVAKATEQAVAWHAHAPLICLFSCSLAFLLLYAKSQSYPGSAPAMSGRWP